MEVRQGETYIYINRVSAKKVARCFSERLQFRIWRQEQMMLGGLTRESLFKKCTAAYGSALSRIQHTYRQ